MERKNLIIFLTFAVFLCLIIAFTGSHGWTNFQQLSETDKAENLRWLSGALIQAHAAILALTPTITFTFVIFSSSRYSSGLTERLLESLGLYIFLIIMSSNIFICYYVLVSTPYFSTDSLVLFSSLGSYLLLDMATIVFAILAIDILLDMLIKVTNTQYIFEYLKKKIKTSEKKDEAFEDFFSLLASRAEDRDLTGLRIGIETLFDFVIEDEKYYRRTRNVLSDISEHYRESMGYFCFGRVEEMITKGYVKIVKSDNIALISEASTNMTAKEKVYLGRKEVLDAFYQKQIKEKGYVSGMDPQGIRTFISAFSRLRAKEIKKIESSEITFFSSIFSFLFRSWEYINSDSYTTEDKKIFIKVLSEALSNFVNEASNIEMEELREELETFVGQLKKFVESLDRMEPYFKEYEQNFLKTTYRKCEKLKNKSEEKMLLSFLCKKFRELGIIEH